MTEKLERWKMVEAWQPAMYPGEYPEGRTYLLKTEALPHLDVAEFFSAKDARLASAAPEMLEALEDALATCEQDMQHILDNGRLQGVMRAALAKAKGEQT